MKHDRPAEPSGGDVGRRVRLRRRQMGLSRAQLAEACGFAPEYLDYLEERPAAVSAETLVRLADALDTAPETLRGVSTGTETRLPGAAPGAQLLTLEVDECWRLVGRSGVGRLAAVGDEGLFILPVNYVVHEGDLVFRTAHGTAIARAIGQSVAFEVDEIDRSSSDGWSVLLGGTALGVADPALAARLTNSPPLDPWPGGHRSKLVVLRPTRVTGRRIIVDRSRL